MGNIISAHSATWLLSCYALVMTAITADLIAGVCKSRRMGVPRTSRRFRKTALKTGRYMLPMVCLSCIDVMVMTVTALPVLTMVMAAFNIFCEFRSVMESTHDKGEIARTTDDMKNFVELLERLLKHLK